MKSLEDILRAKASSGDLNHVSIAFTNSGEWEVAYRGVGHSDYRMSKGKDVADVLRDALTGRKAAPGEREPTKVVSKPTKPAKAKKVEYDPLGDLM